MKVPAKIINNHLQSVEEEQGYKTTFKQREWLRIYLETKNATEAAAQVYDCKDRKVAANIGWENVRKLDMTELMDAMGMTDDYLADKVKEGMEKPSKPITVKTADGLETKLIPDYQTRHKYVDTALRLKKKLSDKLEVTGKDGEPLRIQLVAGIGFLNQTNNDRDNIPEQIETIAPSAGSDLAL